MAEDTDRLSALKDALSAVREHDGDSTQAGRDKYPGMVEGNRQERLRLLQAIAPDITEILSPRFGEFTMDEKDGNFKRSFKDQVRRSSVAKAFKTALHNAGIESTLLEDEEHPILTINPSQKDFFENLQTIQQAQQSLGRF